MSTTLPNRMNVTDSAADKSSVGHLVESLDTSKMFHASTSFLPLLSQIRVNSASQTRCLHPRKHLGEWNIFGEKMKQWLTSHGRRNGLDTGLKRETRFHVVFRSGIGLLSSSVSGSLPSTIFHWGSLHPANNINTHSPQGCSFFLKQYNILLLSGDTKKHRHLIHLHPIHP